VEPIILEYNSNLATAMVRLAGRDGIAVARVGERFVFETESERFELLQETSESGVYFFDLSEVWKSPLERQLERLLVSSGANCNIITAFNDYQHTYRCMPGTAIQCLRSSAMFDFIRVGQVRMGATGEEFHYLCQCYSKGTSLILTSGAAYDPVQQADLEYAAIGLSQQSPDGLQLLEEVCAYMNAKGAQKIFVER
jgi:hypothetical protein